jgi:hypothetical protein
VVVAPHPGYKTWLSRVVRHPPPSISPFLYRERRERDTEDGDWRGAYAIIVDRTVAKLATLTLTSGKCSSLSFTPVGWWLGRRLAGNCSSGFNRAIEPPWEVDQRRLGAIQLG